MPNQNILTVAAISYWQFRNAEHVQFYTNVRNVINQAGAETIGMAQSVFMPFLQAIAKEQDIVNRATASTYTREMDAVDKERVRIFRLVRRKLDLVNYVGEDSPLYKLQGIVNTALLGKYSSSVASLPYQEKTSTLTGLVQDCRTLLKSADVKAIGIDDDLDALEAENQHFNQLYQERISERSLNPVVSTELRNDTDNAYKIVVLWLNALANCQDTAKAEQTEACRECVSQVNQVVKEAKQVLSNRMNGITYIIDSVTFADPDQQLPALMSELDFVQVKGQKLKASEVKLDLTILTAGKPAKSLKMTFQDFADTYHAVITETSDPNTGIVTIDMDRWQTGADIVTLNEVL